MRNEYDMKFKFQKLLATDSYLILRGIDLNRGQIGPIIEHSLYL